MDNRTDWLVKNLNVWTKAYDEGHPVISDAEWDSYYFELVRREMKNPECIREDSPTQKIIYEVKNSLNKVTHNHFMGSLAKTKDKEAIHNFLGNHIAVAMGKMDGLTCSLTYKGGKLVGAETRGNGEIGEDILHNIVTVKGVPHRLPSEIDLVVDGEVICTVSDFDKFKDEYANPRNFAAGSIRLLNNAECKARNLTFVAWDIIGGDKPTLSSKLNFLDTLGFKVVPFKVIENDVEEESSYDYIVAKCSLLDYPIDGLVFKYDDCAYYDSLGRTSHHFKGGIAFKMYDELYETSLTDIEWSLGRTGQITPIAIFDSINIDGTEVSRASLSNLSVLKQTLGTPFIGQKIYVSKRNMIIPKIEAARDENGNMIGEEI